MEANSKTVTVILLKDDRLGALKHATIIRAPFFRRLPTSFNDNTIKNKSNKSPNKSIRPLTGTTAYKSNRFFRLNVFTSLQFLIWSLKSPFFRIPQSNSQPRKTAIFLANRTEPDSKFGRATAAQPLHSHCTAAAAVRLCRLKISQNACGCDRPRAAVLRWRRAVRSKCTFHSCSGRREVKYSCKLVS